MITLQYLRKIEPAFEKLSDEELNNLRTLLYSMGQLAFDCWIEQYSGSKNPRRVNGLPDIDM